MTSGSDRVVRAVRSVLDDLERTGAVDRDSVLRVFRRRGLDSHEMVEALERLRAQGIDLTGDRAGDCSLSPPQRSARDVHPSTAVQSQHSGRRRRERLLDGFSLFLERVAKYGLLDAEKEVRLGRRVRAGLEAEGELAAGTLSPEQARPLVDDGRRARDDFVVRNIRLVVSIAKWPSFEGHGVDLEDRVQFGILGLFHAVEKFDPENGFKFSTYATWWIRQQVERALADTGRLVRLPVHVVEDMNRVRRARERLEVELGRPPSPAQIADELDLPVDKVAFLLDGDRPCLSLDQPIGENLVLADVIAAPPEADPGERVVAEIFADQLWELVRSELDERSYDIIRRRHGFGAAENGCDTLEVIGQDYGVTRERIRQIEAKALKKLAGAVERMVSDD